MTRRTRWPVYVRRSHLCLEQLEDRTTLSGLNGPVTPQATLPASPSNNTAPATSTPANAYETTTTTGGQSSGGNAATSSSGPSSSDTTPNDDDYTYATDSPSGNTMPATNTTSQSGQTMAGTGDSKNTISSGAGTDPPAAPYSTSDTSTMPTPSQTTSSDGSYYPETPSQTTSSDTSYYPQNNTNTASGADGYYSADYYNVEYAKQEAAAAVKVGEVEAFRVLQLAQGTAESPPVSVATPRSEVAPAAPNVPAASNGALVAASVSVRTADAEAIPALSHRSAPADWLSELETSEAEGTNDVALAAARGGENLAVAQSEPAVTVPEGGGLLAGAVRLDLEALERDVGRFFSHLESEARSWLTWPVVANLGWWLAATTAATAAFELARRSARASMGGGIGAMTWQDPALSLFIARDEP